LPPLTLLTLKPVVLAIQVVSAVLSELNNTGKGAKVKGFEAIKVSQEEGPDNQ
jgi:hypothetical protein